jgi:hypothetical protein
MLKLRNRSNFLRLQAHTIQAITNTYALSINSTPPFWWLLFHLDMLVLAPSTATERSNKSIHATIRVRINSIYSGNIKYVYNMAMSCRWHSKNITPTLTGHNQTAQCAADSDQFCTAIARATSTSVASINNSNIHIVNKLYTQPVPTQNHSPPPPPSQPYAIPGDICTTILHASHHYGAGVNADFIYVFIDLVQANIPSTSINLNFIFNQIYQNNLPPPIKRYLTDVYLFCLHKDPLDKSKLRPLGIPTAIRHLITSHVAHTFTPHKKIACHMLPFNYALGTPNGTNFIIDTM